MLVRSPLCRSAGDVIAGDGRQHSKVWVTGCSEGSVPRACGRQPHWCVFSVTVRRGRRGCQAMPIGMLLAFAETEKCVMSLF